jgi:hypothetical protein
MLIASLLASLQAGRVTPTLSYWCFTPGLSMQQLTEMKVVSGVGGGRVGWHGVGWDSTVTSQHQTSCRGDALALRPFVHCLLQGSRCITCLQP